MTRTSCFPQFQLPSSHPPRFGRMGAIRKPLNHLLLGGCGKRGRVLARSDSYACVRARACAHARNMLHILPCSQSGLLPTAFVDDYSWEGCFLSSHNPPSILPTVVHYLREPFGQRRLPLFRFSARRWEFRPSRKRAPGSAPLWVPLVFRTVAGDSDPAISVAQSDFSKVQRGQTVQSQDPSIGSGCRPNSSRPCQSRPRCRGSAL